MSKRSASGDDAVLHRSAGILATKGAGVDVLDEYARLSDSYRALLHKLNKTLVISDTYQAQIRDYNTELSQRVDAEIRRRLEQERLLTQNAKLAAMGEMLGAIAHQWRQPLSTIAMLVQGLREIGRAGELDDNCLEETTRIAMEQIQCMSETIDTFRGFLRPAKGKLPFHVVTNVRQAVSYLSPRLLDSGIEVILDVTPGDDTALGFPSEFTQAVLSVLNNGYDAILAQQRSSGEVVDNGILLRVCREENWIVVEISDGGGGISPQIADRIFEPYFTTKDDGIGTGIGLYLAKLIIEESMEGELRFSSEPGRTTFRIAVPCYTADG